MTRREDIMRRLKNKAGDRAEAIYESLLKYRELYQEGYWPLDFSEIPLDVDASPELFEVLGFDPESEMPESKFRVGDCLSFRNARPDEWFEVTSYSPLVQCYWGYLYYYDSDLTVRKIQTSFREDWLREQTEEEKERTIYDVMKERCW
ncbi:MAG: hypothetical protein GXX80_00275 [Thermotogaceae bacterium]|nr:hypothetical protein [Thermotogaceae bacterium]